MRAIDVCAGAGGFSLGIQRAGWTVLGVELDADAVDTHRRHVGPCAHADVTEWHPQETADLVVGGVPCQSFSVAGDRGGLADERGQLYRHLVRIAVEAGARGVVLENVEGLLSSPGALPAIRAEMVAAGFEDVRWQVLCAADYGVPQLRYRLFVVGLRAGMTWQWPYPSHAEPSRCALLGLRPWVTVREALEIGTGSRRAGRIEGATGWNGQRMLDVTAPSPAVTAGSNAELLDQPSHTISGGGTASGGAEPLANQGYRDALLGELASIIDRPALTLGAGHDTYPDGTAAAALHDACAAAGLTERPATTVSADPHVAPAGHHERQQRGAVRLTPNDCAILQGFPSGWQWTGTKASQHRQIGNAVPPQLAEAIGRAAWTACQRARMRSA